MFTKNSLLLLGEEDDLYSTIVVDIIIIIIIINIFIDIIVDLIIVIIIIIMTYSCLAEQ